MINICSKIYPFLIALNPLFLFFITSQCSLNGKPHWSNIFFVIRRFKSIMNDRTHTDTGLNSEFIRKR